MFNHIVYIHGFHGSSSSPKVAAMRKHFAPKGVSVSAPEYNDEDPHESYHQLVQHVDKMQKKHGHVLLTGCSLGGFWAHQLSNQMKTSSVLMNPAMHPWETLKKYKSDKFTDKHIATFRDFKNKHAKPSTVHEPRIVLLEKGDDVINPHTTAEQFKGHADVRLLKGGSHRFDNHRALNHAIEELGNTVVTHGA